MRRYLYGYRIGEVDLPQLPDEYKPHVIAIHTPYDLTKRPIVGVSAGCHVEGVALPHPDPECTHTMIGGVKKRMATKTPALSRKHLRKLGRFVDKWLKRNLVPLSTDTDVSFETWLNAIDQPQWRKDQLLKIYQQRGGKPKSKDFVVGGFMKDEHYVEYKHARGIYARKDMFKCLSGPWFKVIEKELFKRPEFVKKIPVKDRAKYITEMLYQTDKKYIATDYSSFESHFVSEVMHACEFKLYKYMTQNIPGHKQFYSYLDDVLAGVNHIDFKNFLFKIRGCRMSGEMCTSLGNGFSNLMLMLYACKVSGARNVNGVVEGDDGLFVFDGVPPTIGLFKEIGFTIKLEVYDNLSEASFCGLIFDQEDQHIIVEPLSKLVGFAYLPRRYSFSKRSKHLQLLKAKSLSFLFQYPGCPILRSLALYGLRMTVGYRPDFRIYDKYHLEHKTEMEEFVRSAGACEPIKMRTRLLMEKKFGITLEQQKRTEDYLDSLNDVKELKMPWLIFHEHWTDYYVKYSFNMKPVPSIDKPPMLWLRPKRWEGNCVWDCRYFRWTNTHQGSFLFDPKL